ncbi:hypothetical protein BU23DRAFT_556344 [Bimuria novae-zelandiae CBS 107.79]|uniref:Uncharacterized protein n=1 Tax=Bimuria novae-zelandiae CBS 107.79 TaxID=1447943 RepID=A0A6A5VCW7_9PLEO|nr:hypothetical protein BU23DRAFT_556344 [Bimuria novae-zelandiae CBS 107.79]
MKETSPDQNGVTHPLSVARYGALMGAGAAVPGLIIGATYGTLQTQTPVLFSLVSGAQWFALGTTFFSIRSSILSSTGLLNWWNITRGAPLHPLPPPPSESDRIRASIISGAATGFTLGFLFRGPRNVIPGTIMFSLFGWGGQHAYEWLDARNSGRVREKQAVKEQGGENETFLQKVGKSRWSPMRTLTDQEYEDMMREKLLKVDVEIALIRDKIEALKKEKEAEEQKKAADALGKPKEW